ncbi:unnamed protein product [Brachionus calyciflorus]|uniref:Aminopeptidase n=1 Tax=Brachionus calyciflorus TaxID=104777 RepID=A0A814C3N4_9BILA|nr:unnamed protein product [Brachionus calyciflorus]
MSERKGVSLSVPVIIAGVASGLGIILLVGLLSGLVGRPNNCIPSDSTTVKPPTQTSHNPLGSTATVSITSTIPFVTNDNRTLPASTTRPSDDRTTKPMFDFRLTDAILPTKYDLLLKLYFDPYDSKLDEKFKSNPYKGEVTISFDVTRPTNKIEFHSDIEIVITKTNILLQQVNSDQNIEIQKHGYLPNQLYEVITKNELSVGSYRIKIEFSGTTKKYGLYQASYIENNAPRKLVTTRFLPTYARTVFPCFDEPSFKAEYEITIEHPAKSIALSNFPDEKKETFSESGQTRLRTKFAKTFKMSSYLVSFAVIPDDYEYKTIKALDNLEIRVYGRNSLLKLGQGELVLGFAKRAIEYFSDYFGINEAIPPKIDLLAVPDFFVDSSKNWGLSAFNEEYLLYSDKVNSVNDGVVIARMVANEFAHYWTGGYVTPIWWDDLWLNEGFSTFFEYQAIDELVQDWDIHDQFINDHIIPIMWEDGFVSSRPLKFDVRTPADISFAFEQLTISKSAAVIRMLHSIVGAEKFKQNIRNYLSSNAFGSVSTYDFYNAFDLGDKIPTTTEDFVDRWLLQKNYPEIAVLIENQSEKTRVNFVQSRFLLSPIQEEDPDLITSPYNYKWEIFLECKAGGEYVNGKPQHTTGSIREFEFFLANDRDHFDLDRVYTWVKCNKDFTGFYVTEYKNELFEVFESVLLENKDLFTIGDRSNLIHNAFELAFLGSKSYAIPNLLSNYLTQKETSMIPFKTFIWHINKIATIIEHRSSFKNLRSFILQMIGEVGSRLNLDLWDDSGDAQTRLLKADLVEFQCRMQSAQCLNKATELFETISDDYFVSPNSGEFNNPVPPNYRPVVYKYHMQNTYDIFDWVRMYEFYEETNNVREREYAIEALGNTRLSFLFDLYLSELLTNDLGGIKDDDIYKIILSVAKNPNGRYFAWYYVREYWNYFSIRFGQTRPISQIVRKLAESFDNVVLLEELEFFIDTTYDDNTDIQFKAVDITINNLYWVADKEKEFTEYFSGFGKKSKFYN